MKKLKSLMVFQLLLLAVALPVGAAEIIPARPVKVVKQYGRGVLLNAGGTRVVLLAGTPYQMGFQYGRLLQSDIRELNRLVLKLVDLAEASGTKGYKPGSLKQAWLRGRKFIDERFIEEMQGVADGAGLDFNNVALANTFPELFHCSGFALFGRATADGKLLHGRILDYMTEVGLQKFAVIVVARPVAGYAFVNIGYAGLIGSVTGMNEKQITIGEMGGTGLGQWDGMPMAFLLRKALEDADTLENAVNIFRNTPRTCEYYYVISDAKIPDARGLACTPDTFEVILPDKAYPKLPYPIKDVVLMSAGTRYKHLAAQVKQKFGSITINDALDFMNRPVAMRSCLHRVLFSPQDSNFWVANAGTDMSEPNFAACYQPYYQYNFNELLNMIPAAELSVDQDIPLVPREQIVFTDEPAAKKRDVNSAPTAPVVRTVAECNDTILPSDNPRQRALLQSYTADRSQFSYSIDPGTDRGAYTVFQVSFPSSYSSNIPANNTVYCEYYKSKKANQRPAVVVLDILEGSLAVSRLIASNLASAGCDACIMTLPNYGKRRAKGPGAVRKANQSPEILIASTRQAVADIRRTVRWLKSQPDIDPGRIGICGTSLGGVVASLAAGVDGRFPRAVFILAGGDLKTILTAKSNETKEFRAAIQKDHITPEALEKMLAPIEPLNFADRLRKTKILMINATNDDIIPRTCAEKLATASGARITWYQTDHNNAAMYLMQILQKINKHFLADQW